MRVPHVLSLSSLLVVAVACGGDDPLALGIAPECNPLGGDGCALPWPSSLYMVEDPTALGDRRLDLPVGALPDTVDGLPLDVVPLNRRSGFSPLTQILITFDGGVDSADLVGHDRIADSLTAGSTTVIVDMATGERVAHFAEVDANIVEGDFDDQAVYLRPAQALGFGRRYAVGITTGLGARGGGALARPAAFQAVLDGTATDHARFEAHRTAYPEILAALDDAGVPSDDLVVAWDFWTSGSETFEPDMAQARDVARAAQGAQAENVTYTVELSQAPDVRDGEIARRLHLDIVTPRIATSAGFFRDASGAIVVDGTITEPVTILVPACATPANKAGIVLYGHGFFGGLDESEGGYPRRFAKDTCSVVIGGLWRGMAEDDIPAALATLNDVNKARPFAEGVWQGIVDMMALAALAKHVLPTELLTDTGDATGESIVDPSRVGFYGISQGAILGSVFAQWDDVMSRYALSVGGGNWAILFERSTNWVAYGEPLKGAYGGLLESVIMQQVVTMGFEMIDGGAVAPLWAAQAEAGKQVLQQMSIGDALVTNLSSMFLARSLALPLLTPAVQEPYGVTLAAGPVPSALVIYDEEPTPLPPASNLLNGDDNVAHENLRRRPAAISQVDLFLDAGDVTNFCTGACACADGACGALP